MRLFNRLSKVKKAIASGVVLAIAAGIPVAVAVLHQGFPITDVDLTARSVWVTNAQTLQAGRLNRQIEELDAAVATTQPTLDVVQNGDDVFTFDPAAATIERIDAAYTTLVEKSTLPADATVTLGDTTLAIVSGKGEVWVVDVSNELSFDPAAQKPDVELGTGGVAVAAKDGTVFAASPDDDILYTIDGQGAEPQEKQVEFSDELQISAVGSEPVVLDTGSNELIRGDGGRTKLPETGLRLQQAGPKDADALVATGDSLLEVPVGGGDARVIDADIDRAAKDPRLIAAPVRLDGCAHAAWSAAQRYLYLCGDEKPVPVEIDQPTDGGRLEFRVNRNVIALNNLDNGNVWLLSDKLRLVDNWDEVTPPQEEETEDGDKKASTESFEDTLADRTEINKPPVARDDDFGVRPGRTTIIPVLDNDTDPDGDVLTVAGTTDIPEEVGKLDGIEGNRALQFTSAPDAVGSTSFRYTIDDGRKGVAEANASIRIVPESVNTAPANLRVASVAVEIGSTVEYNVLRDWRDPDGDELFLVSAAPTTGDIVRAVPDGRITFESRSGELGQKEVTVVVSDGTLTTQGTLLIDANAPGTLKPIATPDFAETFVGEPVVIDPLENDTKPTPAPITLVDITEVPEGVAADPNLQTGTVTFQASKIGTYYVKYSIASGAQTTVGIIRIEVIENPAEPLPPIAVKDTAYLRPDEPTVVKVLNNDVSPAGRVLAIKSVDTTATKEGVSIEVLNNTVIRITSSAALSQQTQFTYTISDGLREATAGVTVVPVPPVILRQPPIAVDDPATVRAGDIIRVPVLDNDTHPDDSRLILDPELVDTSEVGDGGLAFVQGDELRYQAPKEAGQYRVTYRVGDPFGESATATVTFVVTAPDLENNSPPVPEPQIARAFAGTTIKIDLPLDGIDPDGDSVIVTSVTLPPTLGTITEQGPNWVRYKAAADSAGTDTFRYEVEDAYGSKGIGTVSVGVIKPPDEAPQPNAVDDKVDVRPGRTATIPVLVNDSDPIGYALSVVKELAQVDPDLDAEVVNNQVVVTVPDTEGGYTLQYAIDNGQGGTDSAFVQIKVSKNAPLLPPSAEDFYLTDDETKDPDDIIVDVLDTASNPGGRVSDLVVTVEGVNKGKGEVLPDGRIKIQQGDRRIAVAYRVTNEIDDLDATAFIVVPPAVSASYAPPPYLRKDIGPQPVEQNGEIEWELDDIVVVPSGKPPILTNSAKVTATNSDGTALAVDNNTIRYAPAKDFRGDAVITFEVTDGTSADDPNGRTATLSMAIVVGDPDFKDFPPSFTATTQQIQAGEAATQVDLRLSTGHPNPDVIQQVQYTDLSGQTADIQASISGSTLSLSAPLGVQKGTSTTVSFQLKYRDYVIPGSVKVTVVASTRPLPQAVTDAVKGQRNKSQTVNVLGNDFNPFAQDGKALTLTNARLENVGETSARVDFTAGGDVTVVPDSQFIGVVSVIYTVGDATKDPDRQVDGRLQITVRDVPSQPAAPTIQSEGDGQITVAWRTPATNGEPITGYTVRASNGATQTVGGGAASATFTGLSNGQPYNFNVTATNVLGDSQTSAQSPNGIPFGKPSAPGNPNWTGTGARNGNGQITANWAAANGNGRPVSGYTVRFSDGQVASVGASTTSIVFQGNVGSNYTFTVTAAGPAGDGAPSAASANGMPKMSNPAVSVTAGGTNAANQSTISVGVGGATARGTAITYSITGNAAQGHNGPGNWNFTGAGSTRYTVTVTATAGGDSVTVSASDTSPAAPPPAPQEWQVNASVNTCPEEYSLGSGYYSPGGPSCGAPGGWANGTFHIQCEKAGTDWYRFRDGSRSYGDNMLVKGSTITGNKGDAPNC